MTPLDLEILIHYHACPVPHPRLDAPAVANSIMQLVEDRILTDTEGVGMWKLTPKGRAWLAMILATPYPVPAWLDSAGKVVEST